MMRSICVNVHYIDDNRSLNNKILVFCNMKLLHTGEKLANKVFDCLKEWSLNKNVFSITMNNDTSNDSMQKKKLSSIVFKWLVVIGCYVMGSSFMLNVMRIFWISSWKNDWNEPLIYLNIFKSMSSLSKHMIQEINSHLQHVLRMHRLKTKLDRLL